MASRYETRRIAENTDPLYKELFDVRGVKSIVQYRTPELSHPTAEQIAELQVVGHIWTLGDRYWKLAFDNYGDVELWWVIAWYNRVPLESDFIVGQKVKIPAPLELVLSYFEKE